MIWARSRTSLWGLCHRISTCRQLLRQPAPTSVRIHWRQLASLLWAAYLLYSFENAVICAAAFSLRPGASSFCYYATHAAAGEPHPSRGTTTYVASLSGEPNIRSPANAEEPEAGNSAEDLSGSARLQSSGITAPMRHMPRGARLIPGFPGPQFVSLGPSLRYRRRLRRHRRDEGWQFSNLPGKRIFFAARRNHRDQLMHSWMHTRHKQCQRKAKDILRRLQNQSRQIFEQKEGLEEPSRGPLQREMQLHDGDTSVDSDAVHNIQRKEASPGTRIQADVPNGDCLSTMRAALEACPAPEVLRTMSAEALGNLHTTLRELLIDVIVAVAPPELVASAASLGFSLPPASAVVAASPIPWWNSGGGLQPWRGRKEARAQQSRRVNWANYRRHVEPTVAGLLLPKEAAAVVAAERKARSDEVLGALRSFHSCPDGHREKGNVTSNQTATQETSAAATASVPWFIGEEDERLQRLLGWGKTPAEQGERKPFVKTTMHDATPLQKARETEQNEPGNFCGLRRALGAAIDVALLLTEASITKKSGSAAPYSWDSPFLRSAASSRRRKWRERGRPPPGERHPSRQSRRLANRNKRLLGQTGSRTSGGEALEEQ